MKHAANTGGIRSLYAGVIPSLLGIPHVAIQYPLYVTIREFLKDNQYYGASNITTSVFLSKLVASLLTYPHEVLRTRLHTLQFDFRGEKLPPHPAGQRMGIVKRCKTMIREEGLGVMYKGLGVSLIRSFPSSLVTLWTYEKIKNLDLDILGI